MQLSKIKPFLLYEFKDERELVRAIEEISFKFTQDRQSIQDYLADPKLASAYTAFFLLTNIPKFEATLPWLSKSWIQDLKESQFIDVGSGPGTFSIAWREWLGSSAKGILQIETSDVMRSQAKKLWEGLYPGEHLLSQVNQHSKLLFFGHSANEMGPAQVQHYVRKFSPEHILFIEPGTKDFYHAMMEIRDSLIEMGYNILYPCPSSSACPLRGSTRDWCHQFLNVRQDPEVERLSQMARKDRRHLPIIVHGYSKLSYGMTPETRVIRVLPETKFSFEWEVCHGHAHEHWQVMKRGMDRSTLKQLSEVTAGAAVIGEVEKILESVKRVKILSIN